MRIVKRVEAGRGCGCGGRKVAGDAGSFAKSSWRVGESSMGRRVCSGCCCCGDGHVEQSFFGCSRQGNNQWVPRFVDRDPAGNATTKESAERQLYWPWPLLGGCRFQVVVCCFSTPHWSPAA